MTTLTPLQQFRKQQRGKTPATPTPIVPIDRTLTPLQRHRQERGKIVPAVEPPRQYKAMPLWEKAGRSFFAGVGDALAGAGRATNWIGAKIDRPQMGNWAVEAGESIARDWEVIDYDNEFADFDFRDMLNPNFLATRVPRALPFMLSLLPAAVVGAGTAKVGAAAATATGITKTATSLATKIGVPQKVINKVSPYGRQIIEAIGAGTGMRGMESAIIAGDVYTEALAKGKTEKDALAAGDKAFRENLVLLATDVPQVFLGFSPLGKGEALTNTFFRRIAATGTRYTKIGLLEAGEEAFQEVIRKRALGEEIDWWGPRMKESAAVGFLMGLGFGGVGDIYQNLVDRTTKNLPSEVQREIEEKLEGLPPKEADEKRVAEIEKIYEKPTPETSAALKKTVDELVALGRESDRDIGLEVDRTVMVEKPVVEPVKPIPKELEPLAREARKFDTAEEFVNNQLNMDYIEWRKMNSSLIRQAEKSKNVEEFIKKASGGRPETVDISVLKEVFNKVKNKSKLTDFYHQAVREVKEVKPEIKPKVEPEIKPKVEPEIKPAIPEELEPFASQALKFETAETFVDAVIPQLEIYQRRVDDIMVEPETREIAEAIIPLLKNRKKLVDFYNKVHKAEKERVERVMRPEVEVEEGVKKVVRPKVKIEEEGVKKVVRPKVKIEEEGVERVARHETEIEEEVPVKGGKPAKVAKDIMLKAEEMGINIEEINKVLAEYTPTVIKEQIAKIEKLMEENMDKAKKMILKEEPLGDIKGALLVMMVENYAMKNKDGQLILDLMKSPLVAEISMAAQTLRLARERNQYSPIAKIKEIENVRKQVDKDKKKVSVELIKRNMKNDLSKTMEKSKNKIGRYSWENLIREITC